MLVESSGSDKRSVDFGVAELDYDGFVYAVFSGVKGILQDFPHQFWDRRIAEVRA